MLRESKKNKLPEDGIRPGVMIILTTMILIIIGIFLYQHRQHSPAENTEAKIDAVTSTVANEESVRELFPKHSHASHPMEAAASDTNIFIPLEITVPPSVLENSGGLKVYGMTLGRGGMVVEVSYQILDTNKVMALAAGAESAYLVDANTGQRVLVGPPASASKMKPQQRARSAVMLKQTSGFPPTTEKLCQNGRIYSVLVPNPGGIFQKKNMAYLMVGGMRSASFKIE